ncbi:MAG: hypothetical protein HKM89_08145, partial [Gemmatimonadales bacterium]|nr:hypothetical protein [Gemmatimonadales bacterium]
MLLTGFGATTLRAQDSLPPRPTGTVEVQVTRASTRQAIAEASVRLEGTTVSARTDANGRAVLRRVPVG